MDLGTDMGLNVPALQLGYLGRCMTQITDAAMVSCPVARKVTARSPILDPHQSPCRCMYSILNLARERMPFD